MSNDEIKRVFIEVKDLSLEKEQYVEDLLRFLTEQLPQIELSRSANDIEVKMPLNMSKRTLKLRLKKYLHQKNIKEKFRPISYKTADHNGYMIKEKKTAELSYY
jgi:hypothetical protein